jgi:hypothetical protein
MRAEGLAIQQTGRSVANVWTCPNHLGVVPGLPLGLPAYDSMQQQWDIGYQYFGGIGVTCNGIVTTWQPSLGSGGSYTAHSPIKLGLSKPYWCLAAEANIKNGANGAWGIQNGDGNMYNNALFNNLPPHPQGGKPAGGNEVFADGSAKWCKYSTMYEFHDWANGRFGFWYQDSTDFDQNLLNAMPSLSAANY